MTEHTSIVKNNQNTYYPRFSFTPKTGTQLPETGVVYLLCDCLVRRFAVAPLGLAAEGTRQETESVALKIDF